MRVTELTAKEWNLWTARALVLLMGLAACLWQWAFWLFVSGYALGFVGVMMQRRILFWPTRRPYRAPHELGLSRVSELWLNTPDGQQILTWQVKPQAGMPTILYLHGNNCNLSNRQERVSRFVRDGYGLMMVSFRGYGLSSGRPSEKNNVNDALLAYYFLRKSGIATDHIIVYGESLGSGVAVQVAARRPVAALVLEAPYTTLRDLVRHRVRFVPLYAFLRDEFRSIDHIKKVEAPLLVVHSLGDTVIPIAFGRWLFEAAGGVKQFLRVRGAGHYGLFRVGAWPKIRGFLETHVEAATRYGETARKIKAQERDQDKKRADERARQAVPNQQTASRNI